MDIKFDHNNFLSTDPVKSLSISQHLFTIFSWKDIIMMSVTEATVATCGCKVGLPQGHVVKERSPPSFPVATPERQERTLFHTNIMVAIVFDFSQRSHGPVRSDHFSATWIQTPLSSIFFGL